MREMPEGWTVRKTRFLWALVDPQGVERSYSLTEEVARNSVWLKPEFGGVVLAEHKLSGFVDL